ncbi:unnamed protein product [Ceratitis capitata]|uniref:(Mediterranean fruit fly) hypothetical protein n=1 Tax=Ceratitis capitata TaxID=7213 RepID=A0A811TX51_CERCA|nr:unnamed protein product [Ceratitis capitata]
MAYIVEIFNNVIINLLLLNISVFIIQKYACTWSLLYPDTTSVKKVRSAII